MIFHLQVYLFSKHDDLRICVVNTFLLLWCSKINSLLRQRRSGYVNYLHFHLSIGEKPTQNKHKFSPIFIDKCHYVLFIRQAVFFSFFLLLFYLTIFINVWCVFVWDFCIIKSGWNRISSLHKKKWKRKTCEKRK